MPSKRGVPGVVESGDERWPAALTILLVGNALIGPMATDFYLPAFPAMAADLDTTTAQLQLTLTAFLAPLAVGQVVVGAMSDVWGRKAFVISGSLLLGLGSVIAACSSAWSLLVVGRALQGLGAAAAIVAGRAMVADLLDGLRAARVYGLIGMLGGVGPMVAPAAGVWVLRVSGWPAIFFVLAGTQVVMLVMAVTGLKETLPAAVGRRHGVWRSFGGLGHLVRNGEYLGHLIVTAASFCVLFSYIAASPVVLLEDLGVSPGAYAADLAVNGLGLTFTAFLGSWYVARTGPRPLVRLGVVTMAAGAVIVAVVAAGAVPEHIVLGAFLLITSGFGLIVGNTLGLAVAASAGSSGSAVALMGSVQFAAAALAPMVLGLVHPGSLMPLAVVMTVGSAIAWGGFVLASQAADSR